MRYLPTSHVELFFRQATVEADAVLQIRVPPFVVNYLDGQRDDARRDAMEYARRLLSEELERQLPRLLSCIRAEVSFEEGRTKETERMYGDGHWVPWEPPQRQWIA